MTVDAYGKTVGGKLKLKGGLSLKCETPRMHFLFTCSSLPADGFAAVLSFCPHRPKKSQKKHKKKRDRESEGGAKDSSAAANFELVKAKGSGRILSSGTTLMGQVGTKFLLELSVGDAIIIQHPTSLIEETRIVRMVLSDISAAISSPFSSDLVSSTSFHYIKAPPEEDNAEQEEKKKKSKHAADESIAFGTYAGGTEAGSQYTYRVKKSGAYGGYAIVKEDANVNRSREDLLDLRSKRKGDRHCM